MTTDLSSLYDKFVAYVARLHSDLDRMDHEPGLPKHRAQLLSYDDFRRMWRRWGDVDGLQEIWRRRFDLGYDQVVSGIRGRLEIVVGEMNQAASHGISRDAA